MQEREINNTGFGLRNKASPQPTYFNRVDHADLDVLDRVSNARRAMDALGFATLQGRDSGFGLRRRASVRSGLQGEMVRFNHGVEAFAY